MSFIRNKTLPSLALAALAVSATPAVACGPESYIGAICMTAGAWCPRGTLEADGSPLSINQQQALFAVIGNAYGGDGRTTFKLPDLRGRLPVGQGNGPGLTPVPQGQYRGSETITLNSNQLPLHSHGFSATPATTLQVPVNASPASAATPNVNANDLVYLTNAASGGRDGLKGIYTKTAPDSTNTAKTPVSGTLSIAGQTTNAGSNAPVTIQPPEVAMRYCVVVDGLWPDRNN